MKHFALIILISITPLLNTQAQSNKLQPPERPKLIVQLVVGQMRNDFLHRYWQNFSDDGFKVLVNEGSFCKNANYNYLLTQSAPGIATLLTGAQPASHGIVSDRWLNRSNNEMVTATFDKRYRGVGGDDMYGSHSPRNMMASTLGDELKRWNPASKVFAVSLDPQQAVLAAGHSGDGAYWLNPYHGTWMTSNFYQKELPEWVSDFNKKQFAEDYVQRSWETLLPLGNYISPDISAIDTIKRKDIEETRKNPLTLIKSLFAEKAKDKDFSILAETPYGNSYSKDFALSAIVNENLGKDDATDLLTVYFAPTADICRKYGTNSVELEDAYYRLDSELAHFMKFLNETIGRENVLVILTSDHGTSDSPGKKGSVRVPGGTFEPKQSIALLKSYLSVTYGKGEWIKGYDQKQIFLNRNLIEDSNINLSDFQNKISEFMVQFSGVATATTATTMTNMAFSEGNLFKMQNSYNIKRSGDIIFFLEPGWTERGETSSAQSSPYSYDAHVPLIFYGWKIKRKSIFTPMDIADVAPTIATFIDISWPNAASGKPLEEMFR
ncbi:alkaline phosphatase family protein [Williamwhitmania taraxaci]|uniref:Type I phosphodiesterase / nucleotide pyrophosphatase n=1 Tax=Williamwhitmania taraxaci TaxID=1640674 RepID=A0A1G6HCZ4_9BACT|nr:alkaline phosphatase family protein [Williamwhitmania taraxaci]SDB92149.1 Type I phosphodiesterase / nucleotide pyrophosphatase [Williamwhitmania taraxaci]